MLKKRIIVTLTLLDGVLFRTKRFVPDLRYTLNFIDLEVVDELVVLDIGKDKEAFHGTLKTLSRDYLGPLTVGPVYSVEDARFYMNEFPVEKVVTKEFDRVPEIATKIGSQSVVASIDVLGKHVVRHNATAPIICGRKTSDLMAAAIYEAQGAGEILLQSVDRDGSLQGYDLDSSGWLFKTIKIPVVIGGGCGRAEHMKQGFEAGASGCSTNNIHHMTKTSLTGFKEYLHREGVAVRME